MRQFLFPFCAAVTLLLFRPAGYTQTGAAGIGGRLIDSASGAPLVLATITLFNAADTTLITYRMSGSNGEFTMRNVPVNKPLRLIISFSGFRVYKQDLLLAPGEQKQLATIALSADSRSLEEVLIFAERPPVIFRKDTIEFNASAFKTLPTALLEDLLKKLPGVQIEADGNIRVNDRRVNRLMVDGKDFFGSDPRIATRNLPADIIDKVLVTDDRDEALLNPDKLPSEIGQIINLKLKKAVKKGWFGKAYAGSGSSERYETGAIVNLFKDTFQVSFLGFANNVDRASFRLDDIRSLAGFDRSGLDDYALSEKGLNVNGISFGGQGEGVSKTAGGGINANHVLAHGLTLNTQYFFGRAVNDLLEVMNQRQFLGDTVLNLLLKREEHRQANNHRVALGIRGRLSETARFEFKPNLFFSYPRLGRVLVSDVTSSVKGPVTESHNRAVQTDEGVNYSHSLVYFQSFRKKDRSFNLSNNLAYGRFAADLFNNAKTTFYDTPLPRDSLLDQLRQRSLKTLVIGLQANWDEPLSERFKFRVNYSFNFNKSIDDLATFNQAASGKYELYNEAYSTDLKRRCWRHSLTPTLYYAHKKWNIAAYVNVLWFDSENEAGRVLAAFEQHYQYAMLGASVRWKLLSLNFGSGVSLPGLADLQPVPDNTNPLYVMYGNIQLRPTKERNASLAFVKPMPEHLAYFSTTFRYSWRDDAIVRIRTVAADGVQESRPINISGLYTASQSLTYRRQHKFSKAVNFYYGLTAMTALNRSYLYVNNKEAFLKNLSFAPVVNTGLNWHDVVDLSANYAYRKGILFYETNDFQNLSINTSSLVGELVIRWPKSLVLETQLDQRYNPQAAGGIQKAATLWNAAVSLLFLKNERAQVKFSVYDLLRRNSNISRQVTENLVLDRQVNLLTQYCLLTFTYNIKGVKGGRTGE